jgi:hypothetical protein
MSYWEENSGCCLEIREYGRRDPSHWPLWHSVHAKVGTNFTDKRRSLSLYSSLADSSHGVRVKTRVIISLLLEVSQFILMENCPHRYCFVAVSLALWRLNCILQPSVRFFCRTLYTLLYDGSLGLWRWFSRKVFSRIGNECQNGDRYEILGTQVKGLVPFRYATFWSQKENCDKRRPNKNVVALETSIKQGTALSSDRLCGLVVRVPGYRSRGPGSIPVATRFSEK